MTQEKKHDPDCIFCKIISEEFPCFKVFENENILAFLDIFPVNLGHIIIVPKEHHENIYQIDEESYSRGYGGQTQSQPLLVTDGISPEVCGDEPKLIAVRTGAPVVVCPNRNLSIDYLEKHINPDVIIADDGLQHYQMARAIELCIVDGKRQFGNGFVMPAGPLREAKSRLKHVDLTITNGTAEDSGYQLVVDGVYGIIDGQKVSNLDSPVHLVSAIGNPSRFEQSVNEQNILVHGHTIFKDHHTYSESDFAALDGAILMTEKDAVKCQSFAKANWYYLKVTAKPTKQLLDKLDQLLIEKGIHNHGI